MSRVLHWSYPIGETVLDRAGRQVRQALPILRRSDQNASLTAEVFLADGVDASTATRFARLVLDELDSFVPAATACHAAKAIPR